MTGHWLINPEALAPPSGYAHVVVANPGRAVHVAGQIASAPDGSVIVGSLVEQFGVALDNVVTALAAAGAEPHDVVSMQIFTIDIAAYRAVRRELGEGYRARFGGHYPAMAVLGVTELFDPNALVEVVAIAVVPGER